jgi:hypothetical protein
VTVSLLDRRIYSLSDVDRLLVLPPGTARRWIDGYDRGGVHYPPVVRAERTRDEDVSWGEFVETRLLAEFRARGASMHRLRPAVVRLREEFGAYPLAHARPFLDVEGRELVHHVQREVGSVVSFLRVPSPGVGDPRSTGRFFDQVPDALASGDLELPLLRVGPSSVGRGKTVAESVVAFSRWNRTRCGTDGVEGAP